MLRYLTGLPILSALLLAAPSLAFAEITETAEKIIRVKGPLEAAFVTIIEDVDQDANILATCNIPCEEIIKTNHPFKIKVTIFSKPWTLIRKEKHAKFDGKTYTFHVKLGKPETAYHGYVQGVFQSAMSKPEYAECKTFTDSDLGEKAKACFRFPPPIPAKSVRSGVCQVRFYVLPDGSTDNVHIKTCSEKMFESSSIEAVRRYRYYPKFSEGRVVKSGVQTTLRYEMRNKKGDVIPAKKLK